MILTISQDFDKTTYKMFHYETLIAVLYSLAVKSPVNSVYIEIESVFRMLL